MTKIDAKTSREIEAAFAQAQARTGAPLACVVAEASADYALAPSLGAAALALFAPWPLIYFTAWPASRIFLFQLLVFALALAAVALTPVRAALASRTRRRSACHRAALVQFSRLGLAHAPRRNGALLYVSLAERYVRIVSDAEIPQEAWRGVVEDLGAGVGRGEAGSALKAAALRMGELLGAAFPPDPGAAATRGKRFHML